MLNMYFCCKVKCIYVLLKCYQHCCLQIMGKPRKSISNTDFGKEAKFEALVRKDNYMLKKEKPLHEEERKRCLYIFTFI